MTIAIESANANQLAFRGLASLAIVLGHMLYIQIYHLGFASYEHWGWFGRLILFRFLAVDGFFMLSGCLLTLSYWDRFTQATKGKEIDWFYLKRIARIYPMHLFGMSIIAIYALVGIPHPIASGLQDVIFEHWQWTGALNLLLMHGWGIVPVAAWNEPSWTLSILFMLYVIFPNLVLTLKRLPAKAGWYVGLMALLLLAYYCQRIYLPLGSASDGAGALIRGVVMFTVGILIARLQMLEWMKSLNWNGLMLGSIIGLVAVVALWWLWFQFDVWPMQLCIIVLMFSLFRAEGCVSKAFANPITRWLGMISFSLYILHYPIIMGLTYVVADEFAALAAQGMGGLILAYVLAIGAVLGGAYAGYKLVEQPTNRLTKRLLQKKSGA